MPTPAIDTLKVAQRLEHFGFSREQASGAAEVLADLLSERAGKDATATTLALLAAKLETMDQRQQSDAAALRVDTARLQDGTARIEALLAKLLDGQAVLLQNDMELKRRLDERG